MNNSPAYYRARLAAFEQVIVEEKGGDRDEKNNNSVILRNGVIPDGYEKRIDAIIQENRKKVSNSKLLFEEITRFNTWFEMYPEKVAGTEVVTTSREFPIMIKGTEEDLIQTVTPSFVPDKKEKRIRMAKAKAMARKRSIELMNI
jgi:hypothetical protein